LEQLLNLFIQLINQIEVSQFVELLLVVVAVLIQVDHRMVVVVLMDQVELVVVD
tara:strand:- start:132 stop:293 length:162 start_codon:yes stop_codon:yes gene_type:complete